MDRIAGGWLLWVNALPWSCNHLGPWTSQFFRSTRSARYDFPPTCRMLTTALTIESARAPPPVSLLVDWCGLCHLLVYDVFLGLVCRIGERGRIVQIHARPLGQSRHSPESPHVHYNEDERCGLAMCGRCRRGVTRGRSSGGAPYIVTDLSLSVVVGLYQMRNGHVTTARQWTTMVTLFWGLSKLRPSYF